MCIFTKHGMYDNSNQTECQVVFVSSSVGRTGAFSSLIPAGRVYLLPYFLPPLSCFCRKDYGCGGADLCDLTFNQGGLFAGLLTGKLVCLG